MYDILQLNDMLVPELLDIAEQLNIPNAKKSDKQELIYKILDRQALASGAPSKNGTEKPKRKRIIKANTANTTEEAEVISEPEKPVKAAAITPQPEVKEDKLKDFQYASVIADRSNGTLTVQKVLDLMANNTVLSASEAVELGIAHAILS